METNPQLALARQFIETTGTHLFLTGKAGTGKTTFLRQLKADSPKRMIVVAPTGIAALQAGGVTIHSFFQLPLSPYIPGTSYSPTNKRDSYRYNFRREKINIIRSIDLLVIDEVSMVRADLLDAVDAVMRRYRRRAQPFGGVQLLMIGDLQQLAPVVKDDEWTLLKPHYDTPYFFSSQALRQTHYCTIELTTVYRQTDTRFLDLLNRLRDRVPDGTVISALNRRYRPDFNPPDSEGYVRLVTHVNQAQRLNTERLDALPGRSYTYAADVTGQFPEFAYPTDRLLTLKVGTRVMFVKNDSGGNRYYNGLLGLVTRLDNDLIEVSPQGGGATIALDREQWENSRYTLNETTHEISETVEGTFSQYPLKLAWAITIHKSQGLTFDRVIIDAAQSFAHGQTYVALSRCRTLEGVVLSRPLEARAFINDDSVNRFTTDARATTPTPDRMMALQQAYYTEQVSDLFTFTPLEQALQQYVRTAEEFLYKLYPKLTAACVAERTRFLSEVSEVSRRFAAQYTRLIANAPEAYTTDPTLDDRLRRGAAYFEEHLAPLSRLMAKEQPEVDNSELRQRLSQQADDLRQLLKRKATLLHHVAHNGFALCDYLRQKAVASIEEEPIAQPRRRPARPKIAAPSDTKKSHKKHADKATDIAPMTVEQLAHHPLYRRMQTWRRTLADEQETQPYMVIQQKAMVGICTLLPTSHDELKRVPYVGQRTIERYGDDIIDMVKRYISKTHITKDN